MIKLGLVDTTLELQFKSGPPTMLGEMLNFKIKHTTFDITTPVWRDFSFIPTDHPRYRAKVKKYSPSGGWL